MSELAGAVGTYGMSQRSAKTLEEASSGLQQAMESLGKASIACGEAHGQPEVVAHRAAVLHMRAWDVANAASEFQRAAFEAAMK